MILVCVETGQPAESSVGQGSRTWRGRERIFFDIVSGKMAGNTWAWVKRPEFIRILTMQRTLMGKIERTIPTLTQRGRTAPTLFYLDNTRLDVQRRLVCRNSNKFELFNVRKVALLR